MTSNGQMILNDELGKIWMEAVVTYLNIFWYLPENIEGNHDKPLSRQCGPWPRIETGTF